MKVVRDDVSNKSGDIEQKEKTNKHLVDELILEVVLVPKSLMNVFCKTDNCGLKIEL